jgi:hypothetical protein
LLVVDGLLVASNFRRRLTRCVGQRMWRVGWLNGYRVGSTAFQAPGFRFWSAVLALIGLILFVLACGLEVRAS